MTDEIINRPMTIEEQFESALQRITALEEAQVKQATDLVKALADLSSQFRGMARLLDGDVLNPGEYDQGRGAAYRDTADRVDALSIGPVMQQALEALDARIPE